MRLDIDRRAPARFLVRGKPICFSAFIIRAALGVAEVGPRDGGNFCHSKIIAVFTLSWPHCVLILLASCVAQEGKAGRQISNFGLGRTVGPDSDPSSLSTRRQILTSLTHEHTAILQL